MFQDQTGPLNWDDQRRIGAAQWDREQMADEIGGFNEQRIYPGLSTDPRDVALRQYVSDALTGSGSNQGFASPIFGIR